MEDFVVTQQNTQISVSGHLTVNTVEGLLSQVKPLVAYDDKMIVDLGGIKSCDSASLAFLVAVLREGKLKRSEIVFSNMSKQISDLSRVSGIDGLITLL